MDIIWGILKELYVFEYNFNYVLASGIMGVVHLLTS